MAKTSTDQKDRPCPEIREAMDAASHRLLGADPANEDAKLDVGLDESFPTSDAPAQTRPGSSKHPPISSGYDEKAEASLLRRRARMDFLGAHWPSLAIAAAVGVAAALLLRRRQAAQ